MWISRKSIAVSAIFIHRRIYSNQKIFHRPERKNFEDRKFTFCSFTSHSRLWKREALKALHMLMDCDILAAENTEMIFWN